MPTGYTSDLHDGEQSFEAFVWNCARAFGALVMMRDDPADRPVPEKLDADNFYELELRKSRAELAEWEGSSPTMRLAMYEAARLANERVASQIREERTAVGGRYRAMLELVRAWRPPSEEHIELRKFMIEQLEKSIEFDCSPYEPDPLPAFQVWERKHGLELHRTIVRHVEESQKERERNESRQRWVDKLRESVPQPSVGKPGAS